TFVYSAVSRCPSPRRSRGPFCDGRAWLFGEGNTEVFGDGGEDGAVVVEAADAEVVFVVVGVDEVAEGGLGDAPLVEGPVGEVVEEGVAEGGELFGRCDVGELVDLELALEGRDVGVEGAPQLVDGELGLGEQLFEELRSEERRVGKEWRSRGSMCACEKEAEGV